MRACYQTAGQDMLQHGEAVAARFQELLAALREGKAPAGWRLPTWLDERGVELLLPRMASDAVLAQYHRYHDCGKPLCRTVDEQGRQHFPDHARVSAQVWRRHGGSENAAQLIEQDMDIHCLAAEGVEEFAGRWTAASLLLTGLAEVHANAAMFGGLESTSFKMKFKHLERRGRAVLKHWA